MSNIKKGFWKTLGFVLSKYDFIWSVLGSFIVFYLVQTFLQRNFNSGGYDLSFISPLFLTGSVMFGLMTLVVSLYYFYLRGLFRAIYKKDVKGGLFQNFQLLTPWQSFIVVLSPFFFLLYLAVKIYLTFI